MRPGDQFEVQITGIDCDTVKEDQIPGCNNFGKRDPESALLGVFYSGLPTSPDNNFLVIAMGDMDPGPYVAIFFSICAVTGGNSILLPTDTTSRSPSPTTPHPTTSPSLTIKVMSTIRKLPFPASSIPLHLTTL